MESRTCRFGPFELDSGRRRLTKAGELVWLPDRQMDVLLVLTEHAGRVVSKDDLGVAAWHGVAVTDNTIVQAVRGVRQALDGESNGTSYIETLARHGYRFTAPVEQKQPGKSATSAAAPDPLSEVPIASWLDPYDAFVDGRAVLETLDGEAIGRAHHAFAATARVEPNIAGAHVGLANACFLAFESTRADALPNWAALAEAEEHAREGCRLDRRSGEAWGTLAVVRYRRGARREAIKAARKAVTLEPLEWRHYLRLASVSWGVERLGAAQRALSLCPGLALGYWFAATVFVARQDFDTALDLLCAGCAAQDAQQTDRTPFAAIGLHLLHGLVLAALASRISGDEADAALASARAELSRELRFEDSGHVYARECAANTWYAIGALHLREGHRDEAGAAFRQALTRMPGHARAAVGLAAINPTNPMRPSPPSAATHEASTCKATTHDAPMRAEAAAAESIDTAIVRSAALALRGQHREAARVCGDALGQAEPGEAGWLLPVEPLLHATAHHEAWARTLATLRDRAL